MGGEVLWRGEPKNKKTLSIQGAIEAPLRSHQGAFKAFNTPLRFYYGWCGGENESHY